jgi:hypothetical protein
VTIQYLQSVKYLCEYGTDNCNHVCPGIKGVTSDVQTRAFMLLSKLNTVVAEILERAILLERQTFATKITNLKKKIHIFYLI